MSIAKDYSIDWKPNNLSAKCPRFFWGGIGATIPLFASVALADAVHIAEYIERVSQHTSVYELAGYGVRILGLFLLGGLWAYLHKTESEPLKLLQLGVVAPAIIVGMINANNAGNIDNKDFLHSSGVTFELSLISSAYAQDQTESVDDDSVETDESGSPIKRFVKGFLGQ